MTAEQDRALLGALGLALSELRPAGVARFGERRVDVVSDGEFIPPGEAIRVIAVDGNRIVVERASEDE